MGGGGGDNFGAITKQLTRTVIDPLIPESIKKLEDKFIPEGTKATLNDYIPTYENTSGASTPEVLPEVPTIGNAVSQAVAKASAKRSAVARSRSIFTSPLGLGTTADTAKKILLGQ